MNYVTQGKMLIFFSSAYEYRMGEKVMKGKNHIWNKADLQAKYLHTLNCKRKIRIFIH